MSVISFLLPAILACILLTGIHTYLGHHVVARGVIFVDLALAQIAALGMTIAFLMGHEPESEITYFFALGFTFLGALFFARFREEKIPEEALIGVSFAVASSVVLLLADILPHGSEHIKYLLNGNILWVTYPQLIKTGIIYAVLGGVHFAVRRKMLLVSTDRPRARAQGLKLWAWDLFFYATFGMVITSSVQIAGILLVFTFLVVPNLCSLLFCNTLRSRMVLGWTLGVATSLAGVFLSYQWDTPTGAMVVATFGGVLAACLGIKKVWG